MELRIAYKHCQLSLVRVERGRLAPLYLVTFFVDATGSMSNYERVIRNLLTELPQRIKEEMILQGLEIDCQARIMIGVFAFSNQLLPTDPDMQNAKQILPYTLLSDITDSDWAKMYQTGGGTPLADAFFLAGNVPADMAFKLSEQGVQTHAISIILTDGQDSDYNYSDTATRSVNYYATPALANTALTEAQLNFKAFRTIVIGVGSSSEKKGISRFNKWIGITKDDFLDAGELSDQQVKNIFTYLVKMFVFQLQQILLGNLTQLALPSGEHLGVVRYAE